VDSDCVSYAVSGPQAPVEILIARWGIPHVYASFPYDAFFAQGWGAARERLDVGPAPRGGSGDTVGNTAYRLEDFRQTGGSSWRVVVDVGEWDNSLMINSPG
jgi:penicillin G amidase